MLKKHENAKKKKRILCPTYNLKTNPMRKISDRFHHLATRNYAALVKESALNITS